MTDLAPLIERVKEGTGEDRELDCLIWATIAGYVTNDDGPMIFAVAADGREEHLGWIDPGEHSRNFRVAAHVDRIVPHLTTSLDAVVALIGEKLPGWGKQVGQPLQKYGATGWYASVFRERRPDEFEPLAGHFAHAPEGYVDTPARALLAALLTALQQQESKG